MTKYTAYIFLIPHLICLLIIGLFPNLEFKDQWININLGLILCFIGALFFLIFIINWKKYNYLIKISGLIVSLILGWYSITYFEIGRYMIECNQKVNHKILKVYSSDSSDMLVIQKRTNWKSGVEVFDTNRVKLYGPFKHIQKVEQ